MQPIDRRRFRGTSYIPSATMQSDTIYHASWNSTDCSGHQRDRE